MARAWLRGGSESGPESDGGSETGAPEQECNAQGLNTGRACAGGTQFCFQSDDEMYAWGKCISKAACVPGTVNGCNCEVSRASFVWRDGLGREHSGEVIDVHLACQ